MWRSSRFLFQRISFSSVRNQADFSLAGYFLSPRFVSSDLASEREDKINDQRSSCGCSASSRAPEENVRISEAKRLLRLVNVEALKRKLEMRGEEVIDYSDLLRTCESTGLARSADEAAAFARALDDAGVVFLFRDKVYLHPNKIVELVSRALPLPLGPALDNGNDPKNEELAVLMRKKEEIDKLAHRHVRRILWAGLAGSVLSMGFFFRLTFWEFSWDVMEPIAFFTTTTGLVIGYAYFLITANDPSYQDVRKRLFFSKQRKLFKKHNFDIKRLEELQRYCQCLNNNTKIQGLKFDHLE